MPVFTNSQLKRFSNIFDNAGQVMLGSLVINPLLTPASSPGLIPAILLGAILTLLLWWVSLRLERISI
jgi:hypothetical protein